MYEQGIYTGGRTGHRACRPKEKQARAYNSRKVAGVSETVFKQHLLLVDKVFI